jgi:hypothetical protein
MALSIVGDCILHAIEAISSGLATVSSKWAEMGEIVNLRKFRKQSKKRENAALAVANRVVHGRSKAERELDDKRTNRLRQQLDGHKIDSGDA